MSIDVLAEPKAEHNGALEEKGRGYSDAAELTVDRTKTSDSGSRVAILPSLSADLAQTWLVWQCKMVAGLIRGAVFLPVDVEHNASALSTWPLGSENEPQLNDIATQALAEKCGVVRSQQHYGPSNNRTCDLIACPLLVDDEPVGVVAIMITIRSESQQHAVLQLLQWGGLWMETLVYQQCAAKREYGAFALTLMASIFSHSDSQTAAVETVNLLADHFGCERVNIGFRKGLQIRLQALSHIASFDPRTQVVRRIEAAMEEAVDQTIIINHPSNPDQESAVIRAHVELAGQQGNGAVCTIPLSGQSGVFGAITLVRGASQPFDKDTVVLCGSLARLIGPALDLKQRDERSFWSKGAEALLRLAADMFGSARLKLKVAMLATMAMVTALSLIDGSYVVTAPASIEGAVRHMLVAPKDGYVKQAEVRAGDLVKKGQLIASLDERNLQLERHKWQSERNKIEKEYQEALGEHARSKLGVLKAQIDQVDAELRLVEGKIMRTKLYAPFEGIVVSGDLSQSLGAPVEIGQVLYEVAPLDSYRVVLEVGEQDIAGLDTGKSGQLIIAALPQTSFSVVIDQVAPVAVTSEARNFFRVEASLDKASLEIDSLLLLPGMQGVAKIEMGQRNLLWIWTHRLIERIRLWLWLAGW